MAGLTFRFFIIHERMLGCNTVDVFEGISEEEWQREREVKVKKFLDEQFLRFSERN